MSPATAPLDAIDRGFLRRFADRTSQQAAANAAVTCEPVRAVPIRGGHDGGPAATAVDPPPAPAVEQAWPSPVPGPEASLVERLLHAAPQAWDAIARRVEDAHRNGAEVIAVAGARRGEGRTTVVACLARTLTTRGRRIDVVATVPCGGTHDDGTIVLVDAGVWFPGGPLRRTALERMSLGCHAAILVRRADQPECAARGTAIEAVGLRLLGEILTMVPAAEAVGAFT